MSGRTVKQQEWSERRCRFLAALRETGNVTAAAKASGLSRGGAHKIRATDADFRTAWDEAVESILDDLEAALCRRAIEGTEKPVYYGGREVGSVRSYNDSAAMFLLRARRPSKYSDRPEYREQVGTPPPGEIVPDTPEVLRGRLEAKLARLEAAAREEGEG